VPTSHLVRLGIVCLTCMRFLSAQEKGPPTYFRVDVDMVTLTLTVTDAKGNYVNGLKPDDFRIREDDVSQKIVAFAEGSESPFQLALAGAKVFILFDTSNWMYTGFPYASDAIAEFVRRLDRTDSVAVYKFSRNLFRAVSLTRDRDQALSGVRSAVAGDDTALYNALLLTLLDAAKAVGRKVVVLFSNGPDNASIIAPSDVGAVAEDEGIPIYIVSTREAQKDPISANAFEFLAARTGGQLYWARTWRKQAEAFTSIREDLASAYTVAYYPVPNTNEGFRKISVDVVADKGKKFRVRTRLGYHVRRHS
jgi:Ca-activated chloride channel family protein